MSPWTIYYFKEASTSQSPPPESQAVLVTPNQDCLEIDEHLYPDIGLRECVSAQLS